MISYIVHADLIFKYDNYLIARIMQLRFHF